MVRTAMTLVSSSVATLILHLTTGVGAIQFTVHKAKTQAAESSSLALEFDSYMTKFDRTYAHGSAEYLHRLELFQHRVGLIKAQNDKPDRLWTAGASELTDRTEGELAPRFGWRRVATPQSGSSAHAASFISKAAQHRVLLETISWRNLSMAKDVPDQGGCGSCWAVATTTMLQARYEIHMKRNRTFSAQQLVNCVPNPKECGGQGGCAGATVELALEYITKTGLEEDGSSGVPYEGTDMKCKQPMLTSAAASSSSSSEAHALHASSGSVGNRQLLGLQRWYTLPPNEAAPLMRSLADGPVAIAAAASGWSMYSSGIYNSCSKDAVVDHAVVVFGYSQTSHGTKYWLVRNSWGKSWGEDGYIRLYRQETPDKEDLHCGVDADPSAGIACKPYPTKQTVCGMCGLLLDSVAAEFS